jgi:hypothetical protein
MARGFESKMVEFQQEEAARRGGGGTRAKERSSLELARARAAADLERATNPAHRKMLEAAIAALDAQLKTEG